MYGEQQLYEVTVPGGTYPGTAFQATLGGTLMMVTCPEGAGPGSNIQVAGPGPSLPTVAGVPVTPGAAGGVAAGLPVPHAMMDVQHHSMMGMRPEVAYVEVEEVRPESHRTTTIASPTPVCDSPTCT